MYGSCKNFDQKSRFLSYTYKHPVQLEFFNIFHYSSVDNLPKLTKIGKNGKITNYFLLFFNSLKFGKTPLFCCNG